MSIRQVFRLLYICCRNVAEWIHMLDVKEGELKVESLLVPQSLMPDERLQISHVDGRAMVHLTEVSSEVVSI